jgi:hypothetical protein
MWLLDHKLNAEKHLHLLLQHHQVQERELVQEAKVPWRFPQPSQHGELLQQRSHYHKTLQEMLSMQPDGHQAHVNSKAWHLHPDLDENRLDLFPMLTIFQHTLLLPSPLLDRILAGQ